MRAPIPIVIARLILLLIILGAGATPLRAQSSQPSPPAAPSFYAHTAPLHSAEEILQSAIQALSGVKSVEYEVRALPSGQGHHAATVLTGRTTVIATVGHPIRYRARFQADSSQAVELAVSNGEKVRISSEGELREYPTRTMEDSASADALPTLLLFDAETYRKALAGKNALYAGQDDIEGDLCYVIAVSARFAEDVGSDTFYFWISARTGLPRSRQTYRILHGETFLTYRWIVSNIRINPPIPPETFLYHPLASDSTIASAPAKVSLPEAKPDASLAGRNVPDLEVRDADYKPVSLARVVKGKATILTLWASWCGPCVEELPIFQELADRYPDKLQVIALTVEDSRLAALNFIQKHHEYKFTFVTDPELGEPTSKISQFFVGEGVPRNVFVDPQGRIVDYELGSYAGKEDELKRKVDRWIKKLAGGE
jgi:cytochrome c biogenesis protein CcmG/thiol:disulfide interchange protein DsbE